MHCQKQRIGSAALVRTVPSIVLLLIAVTWAAGQDRSLSSNPELEAYFASQVEQLEKANELTQFKTLEQWENERAELRSQLFDMLGLEPLPKKRPLQAQLMGTVEHPEFTVERLHFQSLPGLYVTANLYLPRPTEKVTSTLEKYPTILYVCGHAQVKKDGVSYGNKTHYQHHGAWFARNGYVCLTIDTLQRGEIEGVHHGTYRLGRWWWNARGYTPAGLEAWNCIRALDYLETRAECDLERIGVTGRSGGGIYSWWITAIDDRVKCAVPVAGITSMRDQVVRGCVEGHCDCMFMVNTYRWDFAKIAALAAPRPLLISNTDKDTIFPLEGVIDMHRQVRHIYELYGAASQLGLQITEGPHADTQELHLHAFRWFNRFLKKDDSMVEKTAEKFFPPEMLKVFETLPDDELNTRIDEQFVAPAKALSKETVLRSQDTLLDRYRELLANRCFRAWPTSNSANADQSETSPASHTSTVALQPSNGKKVAIIEFQSEPHVSLQLRIHHPAEANLEELESVRLSVLAAHRPIEIDAAVQENQAQLVVRPNAWQGNSRKQTHIKRRYQLLGMTLEGMQVWDIRRGLQVLRKICPKLKELRMVAEPGMETQVMLASLFGPPVRELVVPNLPTSNRDLPPILNLTRTVPVEVLTILAAQQQPLLTSTPLEQLPLIHEVVSDPRWTGSPITATDDLGESEPQ